MDVLSLLFYLLYYCIISRSCLDKLKVEGEITSLGIYESEDDWSSEEVSCNSVGESLFHLNNEETRQSA